MHATPKPTTVDFETEKIERRPAYPPKPVGVAIKPAVGHPRYLAFGHTSGNTCTEKQALKELKAVWDDPAGILFHHGKFDIDVAETHFGLPRLEWTQYHDTLFLLFLYEPRALTLALKPSAKRLLGMATDEQDLLRAWLVKNIKEATGHNFGAYISRAPGDLVGRYAIGDVVRTERIFKKLYPIIKKTGMLEAYDLERELLLVLLDTERRGVRVDLARLRRDVPMYSKIKDKLDQYIRRSLKQPDLNVDSGEQLAATLVAAKKVDAADLGVTPTGKLKTSKDVLGPAITDQRLAASLVYRAQLKTALGTFMVPWLATAITSKGLIFTEWHQVRGGETAFGARTGRLTSTPNFQNIPNELKAWSSKKKPPFPLPPLPLVRRYIVPYAADHVLLDRDYSQQELRILAHIEGGALKQAYLKNPWLDVHAYAQRLINELLNTHFERKPIKNTGFGLIYGMGIGRLAEQSGITVEAAKAVRDAYLAIFPGLKALYAEMRSRAAAKEPVLTWLKRRYYCEEPKIVGGRMMSFDYKLVNDVIQGSAADCTKKALVRYAAMKGSNAVLLLSVHDELVVSAPQKTLDAEMGRLRFAMDQDGFDVLMLSEGSVGEKSWADLKPYDKEGRVVYQCRSPKSRNSQRGVTAVSATTKSARSERSSGTSKKEPSQLQLPLSTGVASTRLRRSSPQGS